MKLQKLISRLEQKHPKKIDLTLERTFDLLKKLGNPQDKIKNVISVVGTNSKYSICQSLKAILNRGLCIQHLKIIPSTNRKVFYIGDAFNGFLPTLAQGAGQSIESAFELFNLIKDDNLNASNLYFKTRLARVKTIGRRSNFNFFAFHFSTSIMQKIRNYFLRFLIKRKGFINSYLGTIYKN